MKEKIKKLITTGFFHVFVTSLLNKVMALVASMVIVRILSKTEYGFFSYAFNIISILLIFSDFGSRAARMQFCCETDDISERKKITSFLLKFGSITNISFVLLTFLYATFVPLRIEGGRVPLQLLSGFLLFQFYLDNTLNEFRIKKDNVKYAILSLINTFVASTLSCLGAYYFNNVGLIIGKYIGFIIPVVIGILFIIKENKDKNNEIESPLDKTKKKEIIKYGLLIMITNCVSSVLYYFDTFFVGQIVSNPDVLADYKVATIIPNALSVIPGAFITFIYPYFVSHRNESDWIKKNTFKLQLALWGLNLTICSVGIVFAPFIITTIFGDQYSSAVFIFRVLLIMYFISAGFRTVYGNVLAMMHLVKVNFVLSSIECVLNIVLDILFIKHYGSVGAAYSSLIITTFSSLISGAYFYFYLRKANKKVAV